VVSDGVSIKDSCVASVGKTVSDGVTVKGFFEVEHRRNGVLIARGVHRNIVVSAGKAGIASRINGSGAEAAFTYLAIGTGSTGALPAQTALVAEISTGGGERAAATCTRVTTTTTNDTAQFYKIWTFSAGFTVAEAGVFNDASAGTMLARALIGPYTVISGDTLALTYKVVTA